jgi:hypothetical protein
MENCGGAREVLQSRTFEKHFKAVRVHASVAFYSCVLLAATIENLNKQIRNLYWTEGNFIYTRKWLTKRSRDAKSYSWRPTHEKVLAAYNGVVTFPIKDPDQQIKKQYWTMHLNANKG